MNRIKTKTGRLLLLTLSALFVSSCVMVDDGLTSGKTTASGEVDVRVSLQMPASLPKTYAITATDENRIDAIDVLAFKEDATKASGWAFAYSAKGTTITNVTVDEAKKQFTVRLIKDPLNPQTFVILANARTQLEALGNLAKGTDRDVLLAQLVYTNTGKWNANNDLADDDIDKDFTPFPMWGEVTATLTDATEQIPGNGGNSIYMVRAVARIDIILSEAVATAGNFTLDKIYIYNSKNRGRIVPDPLNRESLSKVKEATEPSGNINNANPLVYDVPADMNTAFERTVYLFEADGKDKDESSQATCVVVGGKFDSDGDGNPANNSTTYYRLDFLKKEATDSYFRDILRNHRYRMNILSVTGPGYGSAKDAFDSKSFNMIAEVVDWNEGGMAGIVFDGPYRLGVSRDEFSFSRDGKNENEEDENNVLSVFTDYPSGWSVDMNEIVDADDGTTPVSWLTLSRSSGEKDDRTKVVLAFDENNTGANRSAIVWITAGRLRYPVTVTQSIIPNLSLRLLNRANGDITEMVFASKAGTDPDEQTLTVNWKPLDGELRIVNMAIGTNAFPDQSGAPASVDIPAGNNGTGTISYPIKPPAILPGDVTATNPFLEKTSLLNFTVANSLTFENKSVMLRQINYNLVTNVPKAYALDNLNTPQNQTITVRSSFPWEVYAVSDDDGILQNKNSLKEKTGEANTGLGSPLPITLSPESANASMTGKTATITLKNPIDDTTWDIPVSIVESLYVGMFGGKLMKTDDVWQFEKKLYLQNKNEGGADATYQWKTEDSFTFTPGMSSIWDGKSNTWVMRGTAHPAANACFSKNANYTSIDGVGHANYHWYLPAQKQLMAVWVSNTSFGDYSFSANRSWSSTESSKVSSWNVTFANGNMYSYQKTYATSAVRCVREVAP